MGESKRVNDPGGRGGGKHHVTLKVTVPVGVEIAMTPARREGCWRASSEIAATTLEVEARGYHRARALLEMHLVESLERALSVDALAVPA